MGIWAEAQHVSQRGVGVIEGETTSEGAVTGSSVVLLRVRQDPEQGQPCMEPDGQADISRTAPPRPPQVTPLVGDSLFSF